MSFITDSIRLDSEYKQLFDCVKKEFSAHKPYPIAVSGLCDGATDAAYVSLVSDTEGFRKKTPTVIFCPDEKECLRLQKMFLQFGIRAAFYLNRDLNFYNITASHEYEHERLKVLFETLGGELDVIVTTPDAALSYTIPPARLLDAIIKIDTSTIITPSEICRALTLAGFACVPMVDSAGQFAHRGGIVDIFAPSGFYTNSKGERTRADLPVRIEFFGDEIDRMGLFSPESQRMVETVSSIELPPAREIIASGEDLQRVREAIVQHLKNCKDPDAFVEMSGEVSAIDGLGNDGGGVKFIDKYISLIYPERCSLFDYIEERTAVILKGTNAISERIKGAEWHNNAIIEELLEGGTISPKYTDYTKPSSQLELFCDRNVVLHTDSITQGLAGKNTSGIFHFLCRQNRSPF